MNSHDFLVAFTVLKAEGNEAMSGGFVILFLHDCCFHRHKSILMYNLT